MHMYSKKVGIERLTLDQGGGRQEADAGKSRRGARVGRGHNPLGKSSVPAASFPRRRDLGWQMVWIVSVLLLAAASVTLLRWTDTSKGWRATAVRRLNARLAAARGRLAAARAGSKSTRAARDLAAVRGWLTKAWSAAGQWLGDNYVGLVFAGAILICVWAAIIGLWRVPGVVDRLLVELVGAVGDPEKTRAVVTAMAAVLAAIAIFGTIVVGAIRVWTSERQTHTNEQGHVTDRLTKAIEQLGAEKTVKRVLKDADGAEVLKDNVPVVIETSVPNLEVRLGAIYALERIAQDSERDHITIMEILCAYLRENARARDASASPVGETLAERGDAPVQDRIRAIRERGGDRRLGREPCRPAGRHPGCAHGARPPGRGPYRCRASRGLPARSPRHEPSRGEPRRGAAGRGGPRRGAAGGGVPRRGAAGGGEPRRGAAGGGVPRRNAAGGGETRRGAAGGGAPPLGGAGGADLRYADFRNSEWFAVSNQASPAHSADFRGAQGLKQVQLEALIGNEGTLLPEGNAPDTGEPWYVWSCWETPPLGFDRLRKIVSRYTAYTPDTSEELRAQFLCGPGNPRVKTGTRLAPDAPLSRGASAGDAARLMRFLIALASTAYPQLHVCNAKTGGARPPVRISLAG